MIDGNAVILPGVHFGNNGIIAARAVVTHDILDNSLVGGMPAEVIKNIEDNVER